MKARKGALLLTILAGVLWGTSFPMIKIGLNFIDPYMFVFLRMFLASVLVLLISFVTNNLSFSLAKERLVWYLGLLNGFAYLIQYIGMSTTTASKSSLLVNLSAVWVAALSWLLLKERFSKRKLLGISMGLVGVFFITTNLSLLELTQGALFGDGLVFLSGILWSFFIVYNKKIVDFHNAFQLMPWIFLATTLPLTPFLLVSSNLSLFNLSHEAWIIIGYTAVFCWLLPYYLWLKGLKHISPAVSTIILLTEVIVAITISFVFLGETFTMISVTGASLIFLAIILVSISQLHAIVPLRSQFIQFTSNNDCRCAGRVENSSEGQSLPFTISMRISLTLPFFITYAERSPLVQDKINQTTLSQNFMYLRSIDEGAAGAG